MQFDSGKNSNNRIVIFYSKFTIEYAEKTKIFMMDGTFYSCLKDFYQFYTMNWVIFGTLFPMIYVFMQNKNSASYEKLFQFIALNTQISPNSIIFDLEISAILQANRFLKPLHVILACYILSRRFIDMYLSILLQ